MQIPCMLLGMVIAIATATTTTTFSMSLPKLREALRSGRYLLICFVLSLDPSVNFSLTSPNYSNKPRTDISKLEAPFYLVEIK